MTLVLYEWFFVQALVNVFVHSEFGVDEQVGWGRDIGMNHRRKKFFFIEV